MITKLDDLLELVKSKGKKMVVILPLFFVLLVSCENQSIDSYSAIGREGKNTPQNNPDNPFDSVGIIHNQLLADFFRDHRSMFIDEESIADFYSESRILDSVASSYMLNGGTSVSLDAVVDIISDASMIYHPSCFFENDFIGKVIEDVVVDLSLLGEWDYTYMKARIMAAENTIISIPYCNEKRVGLEYLSTLRHSLYFWDSEHNSYPLYTHVTMGFWEGLTIALCDCAGVTIGAHLTFSIIAAAVLAADGRIIVSDDNQDDNPPTDSTSAPTNNEQ